MRWISFNFGATGSTSGGTKGEGASSSRGCSGTAGGSALSGVGMNSSNWGELASSAGAGSWTMVGTWGGEEGVTGVGCCGAWKSGCDFLVRMPVVRGGDCGGTGTR